MSRQKGSYVYREGAEAFQNTVEALAKTGYYRRTDMIPDIAVEELAGAFNQQNDKRYIRARPVKHAAKGASDVVYFENAQGLSTLIYFVRDGRWAVKFNKFNANWTDYIRSIARMFQTTLSTLKSAGLPFEAPPPDLNGIVIEATVGPGDQVFVRYQGEGDWQNYEPLDVTALPEEPDDEPQEESEEGPEPTYTGRASDMIAQSVNGASEMQRQHDEMIAAGAVWDGMDGYDFTQKPNGDNSLPDVL
jgi:hypothetical protein